MGKFSKIYHHISKEDLKRVHEQKVCVQKLKSERIDEERKEIKAEYEKWKSNWRDDLLVDEGMTVAAMLMKTVLSSTGDEVLDSDDTKEIDVTFADVASAQSNNVDGVSAVFDVGPVNDPVTGVKYLNVGGGKMHPNGNGNNKGSGSEGVGFNMGGAYARMSDSNPIGYSPTEGPRYVTLAGTDTTNFSHMRITAIQGTGFEGGDGNGGNGGWQNNQTSLRVRYWLPGMTDFRYLSVNPQGQTTGNADVIVPFDANASTPTNFTIQIPEYARNKDVRFQIYQPLKTTYYSDSGQSWGISNISYQRKTPISAFVSLDSPEASSFIRVGQQPSGKRKSAKEREEDVVNLLKGGRNYTNKILGMQFPGSNPNLSFSTDLPDKDIESIQQQNRDSTYQRIKDRFQMPLKQTKEIKQFSYVQQKYITNLSDIVKNLPDIGLTNSQISNAFKSHEELSKIMEPIDKAYNEKRTKIVGTLDNPPEKRPTKSQMDALNDEMYQIMDFANFASVAISQGATMNLGQEDNALTTDQPEPSDPSKEQIKKLDGGITLKWVPGLETGDPNTRIPGNWTDITDYPKDTGFLNYADYMTGRAQSPSSDTNVDSGTETKPQGLSRVVAGLADLATGQKFDFDKRGNIDLSLVKTKEDLPKRPVIDLMAKAARTVTSGYSTPFDLTIKYALGDMSPITKSPGKEFNKETLKVIAAKHISGDTKGGINTSDYGKSGGYTSGVKQTFKTATVQGAYQTFDYEVTSKGIRIKDRFNFEEPDSYGGSTNIGAIGSIPGAQFIATNLVRIGDLRAKLSGFNPRDKDYGIKIDYVIPKNQLTKQQRDKFYGRDSVYELEPGVVSKKKVNESSTYNRIKNKFFNQKDIKPTFPENPPPEMVNGLHPEYGKRANRYKKLDPISANSMPLTGDPEIDAVVKKQKTFKKFKRNIK